MDSLFTSRPEITHQHRQPEKRTPAIISLAFTAVIVAPLAGFVAAAARVGANLKVCPALAAGRRSRLGGWAAALRGGWGEPQAQTACSAAGARSPPAAQGFPTDGAGFVAAAGFHGGLAAICALYLLFFVKLNLMQVR